jgi:hypothetical protein
MAGPFTSYAPPDVFTRTNFDPAVASLLGGLRIPVLVGVAEEQICVEDLEIFRGSSATADVHVVNEDISSQFDGSNAGPVTVAHWPITTGDGSGTSTTNPYDVQVTINGEPAGVRQVRGSTGEVYLVDIPQSDDEVHITYWFNRGDTLISEEDLSGQADGENTTFKVSNVPIVDGSNGGVTTTDVNRVTVTVEGTTVVPASVDGETGFIELSSAPEEGDEVLVTYYTNTWQDTYDILPNQNIVSVLRVGTGPGRTDYVEGVDFVLVDDQIHWGASYRIESDTHTPGAEYLDDTQIAYTLYDNRRYMALVGVGDDSNREFTLESEPTDGSGRDRVTDDASKIQVYVGTSVADALSEGQVDVLYLEGADRLVTLKEAPAVGQKVYVTYYENLLRDDCYTIEVVTPGGSGVGTYRIISERDDGTLFKVTEGTHDVSDPDFATEGIVWPGGVGSDPDLQTIPGYAVEETVTVTIGSGETFDVTSSNMEGSVGTGELGQTYKDSRTGLRFTVFQGVSYDYSEGDTLEFEVDSDPITCATTPVLSIPGGKLFVYNTTDVAVADSAELCTFEKGGEEPAVGDFYYISYCYEKEDYDPKVYTRFKDIERDFGDLSPSNPLVLAAWLCFLNGAVAVALKQVVKEENSEQAASATFITALQELEKPIEGTVKPAVVVPITTFDAVISALKSHVDKMSNIRYQGERIAFYGLASTTTTFRSREVAESIKDQRMIQVFPNAAIMSLTDSVGNEIQFRVDGSYIAAAVAGLNVNPIYDVATPMTNKQVLGFVRFTQNYDSVELNQLASSGVLVIEDRDPVMIVRHAVSTDPTNVLTREVYVTTTADEVQKNMRANLRQYIGRKDSRKLLPDIVDTVASTMGALMEAEIISAYTGIEAVLDDNDPTIVRVTAYYRPIFGVNWIVVTFNLRTSL